MTGPLTFNLGFVEWSAELTFPPGDPIHAAIAAVIADQNPATEAAFFDLVRDARDDRPALFQLFARRLNWMQAQPMGQA